MGPARNFPFQSSEGEIFMGGINGLNGFFPERVTSFQVPVNPIITSLKASDRVVGVNFSNSHNDTIFYPTPTIF